MPVLLDFGTARVVTISNYYAFSPLPDPVHHAGGPTDALELVFGTVEETAYPDIRAVVLGVGRTEDLLQTGGDILQRQPLATVGIGLRRTLGLLVERKQLLAQLRQALVAHVVLHQGLLLVARQVVAQAQDGDLMLQLGIELVVVYEAPEVDIALYADAYKTAAAAGVGQWRALKNLYYNMPGRIERDVKDYLIHTYSRKRYYEYRNGTRIIPPDVEHIIRATLRRFGWTEEPCFDGYIEEFLW